MHKSHYGRNTVIALSMLALMSSSVVGQVWDETSNGGGDAGDLPPGQVTVGLGPLPSIGGFISNPDLDVDLYCIKITNESAFSASVSESNPFLSAQLWLFNASGFGVAHASDATAPYSVTMTSAFVHTPGIYFIGVSRLGAAPLDGTGLPLFPSITGGETGVNPIAGQVASWTVGSGGVGPYAIRLTGAEFHQRGVGGGPGGTSGPWWTYTDFVDFSQGYLFNLSMATDPVTGDQCLKLNDDVRAWPFVAVPNSNRGTVTRIAVEDLPLYGIGEGDVLGEYQTAPNGMGRDPSRTTVDPYGNIWVTNRAEGGSTPGGAKGSVTRIGLVIGGTRVKSDGTPDPNGGYLKGPFQYSTCEDRDGDGLIKTSRGYKHTTGQAGVDYTATHLPWTNTPTDDSFGGVTTAEDECITAYVRVAGTGARQISIDPANDIWTGGYSNRMFEKLDGATAQPLASPLPFQGPCTSSHPYNCGYGGPVDPFGVLWSAQVHTNLMRYPPGGPPVCLSPAVKAYGVTIDDRTCNIWTTDYFGGVVNEVRQSDGVLLNTYPHGGSNARGLVIDSGIVWVAHSTGTSVGRRSTGPGPAMPPVPLVGPFGTTGSAPHGVSVDRNRMIWAFNRLSNNAMRINPATAAVDLTVDLGPGALPYTYSDCSGFDHLKATAPQGSWTFIHDGGGPGCAWGTLGWNAIQSAGTKVQVRVRASDSPVPTGPWTVVQNGVAFTGVAGRYLQVQVTLQRPGPCLGGGEVLLCDLQVCKAVECEVEVVEVICGLDEPSFQIRGTVTNNSGVDAKRLLFTPQPPGSPISFLPPAIDLDVPNGSSRSFEATAYGWTEGEEFCFTVTLLDESLQVCCSTEVCVTPDCDCLQIRSETISVDCDPLSGTTYFTFQVDNLLPGPVYHAFFLPPAPVTFTPGYVAFPTPIPSGGTSGPITIAIGNTGGLSTLCFEVTLHDEHLVECCGRELCIDLPPCFTIDDSPWKWTHTTALRSTCCEAPSMVVTVMNPSDETRQFEWRVRSLPPGPGCDFRIPDGGIQPSGGTTPPIPPGGFVDIPIEIDSGAVPENMTACLETLLVHAPSGLAVRTTAELKGQHSADADGRTVLWCACPAVPGVLEITPGSSLPLRFMVTNPGPVTETFQYVVATSGPALALDGLEAGESVVGQVEVAAGASAEVMVMAEFVRAPSLAVQDVVLSLRAVTSYPPAYTPSTSITVRAGAMCRADLNGDGVVDFLDYLEFLNLFAVGDPRVDFDGDGVVDFSDYLEFLNHYDMGC